MAPLAKSLMLLAWTVMVIEGNKAIAAFPGLPSKTTVEIINGLAHPPQNLTIHCRSKDSDIGEGTRRVEEKYIFRFRPNAFKQVTLFFCSFRWQSDTSVHHFDIYVQKRDKDTCVKLEGGGATLCSWKIWERGACKYNRCYQHHTECHPWSHPPASSIANTSHL